MDIRSISRSRKVQPVEVAAFVLAHLIQQEHVSTNSVDACRYRGEQDRSCAVGCLIADKDYKTTAEGAPVREVLPHLYGKSIARTLERKGLADIFDDLQYLHDCTGKKQPFTHNYIRQTISDPRRHFGAGRAVMLQALGTL